MSHACRAASRAAAPAVIAIGASTGGPQALVSLLARLSPLPGWRHNASDGVVCALPAICVALHMPLDMMPVIAAYVSRRCNIATSVVHRSCPLREGQVYFAPGDRPLGFRCHRSGVTVAPLEEFGPRRAAVDALFSAASAAFGDGVLAIVLSGMGEDGLAGSHRIVAAGGTVLVQDRASSAVWGMPGVVARAGLASLILPPPALADEVIARIGGREPARAASAAHPCASSPPDRPAAASGGGLSLGRSR